MSWLESLDRWGDRLALVLWAGLVDVGLAWLVFHPDAAAVVQFAVILFVVIRRLTLHHPESIVRA